MLMNKGKHKLIDRTVDYLHTVLGVACDILGDVSQKVRLPYYLKAGNVFVEGIIEGRSCLLVIADELPDGTALAKRTGELGAIVGKPVVLVLENIDTIRRRVLIANRTCFIVPGKQVYLPFMGALLAERGMGNKAVNAKQAFSPAAQVLLLTHLQKEPFEGRIISEIAKQFPYSVKTVSAAAKELEQAGVCTTEGDNSGRFLRFMAREEIWDKAYSWLTSPVQEVLYCDSMVLIPEGLRFVTYDRALSEYTFMANFSGEAFAVYKNDDAIKKLKNDGTFNAVEGKYRIELWKYNPALLAKDGMVDALSLALCYKDSDDERVIGELNNLVKRICKA